MITYYLILDLFFYFIVIVSAMYCRFYVILTALSPLAANVVAAWRSGGGH